MEKFCVKAGISCRLILLASELSLVRVQLRFQIRTYICIYVYIYVAVRQIICACSVVRNVGGVKCNHFHKHSNHFK